MSQENVEVVLQATDAVNRRDRDAFVACLHPDVVWDDTAGFPGVRGVHRGRAEAQNWFEDVILEPWKSLHLEVEQITEASDGRVFAVTFITARGRASGVDTELGDIRAQPPASGPSPSGARRKRGLRAPFATRRSLR